MLISRDSSDQPNSTLPHEREEVWMGLALEGVPFSKISPSPSPFTSIYHQGALCGNDTHSCGC